MKSTLLTLIVAVLAVTLAGCASMQEFGEALGVIEDANTQVAADTARAIARVNAMEDGPQKAQAMRILASAQNVAEKTAVAIDQAQDIVANSDNGPDALEGVVTNTAPLAGPYEPLVALGGLLAASIWRAARNRNAARDLAKSVQPLIDKATADEKLKLSSTQSDAVHRLVDESQGKAVALPL